MEYIMNTMGNLIQQTAFMNLTVGNLIMIGVACIFLYLAIKHGFESEDAVCHGGKIRVAEAGKGSYGSGSDDGDS